jgi:hypothetical protein
LFIDIRQNQPGPFPGKKDGRGPANAVSRPGDYSDLPFQTAAFSHKNLLLEVSLDDIVKVSYKKTFAQEPFPLKFQSEEIFVTIGQMW